MMKVSIRFLLTSQPVVHEDVENTYQKGDLFCIRTGLNVFKYPIQHIFDITEDYRRPAEEGLLLDMTKEET